jgi:hypothetical protein
MISKQNLKKGCFPRKHEYVWFSRWQRRFGHGVGVGVFVNNRSVKWNPKKVGEKVLCFHRWNLGD